MAYTPTYTTDQYNAFVWFIRNVMGINTSALQDNSPVIGYSLSIAVDIVNPSIAAGSANLYSQALNNLAGDNLVNFAQDTPPSTFFTDLRKSLNMATFVPGVISSSSDEGTSESLLNPDFMRGLTLANLQSLKTPWGRQYLAIAQTYGDVWGLT